MAGAACKVEVEIIVGHLLLLPLLQYYPTSTSCKPPATITTTTSTTSCRPSATITTTRVVLLLLLVVDHLVDNCVLLFLVARLGQQVVQGVVHHLLGHSHLSGSGD